MAGATDRPRVLVVDDDALVLTVLVDTLAAEFTVEAASSGAAALELLAARPFDVLLADQRMPGMTGVELAEQARALQPFLVTVLLSAYTDPADMIQAINRGQVYRFLRKPWDGEELRLTLLQAHERCLLRQRNRDLATELERRFAAVEILQQVIGAATVLAGGHPADVLLERLGEVVPHDLVGLLSGGERSGARLQLRATRPVPEANLVELHAQLFELYRCAGGPALGPEQVRLRVDAEVAVGAPPNAVQSQVHLPLRVDGQVVGLLVVQAFAADAFASDAPRLLDLLLNGTAEAIERLRLGTARHWRRIEQVLAVSPDGVVVAGAQGEILLANQAARRMLESPSIRAERLWELLGVRPDTLLEGVEVTIKRQLELGGRSLVASVAMVPATTVEEAAILVVVRDVTELAEEDLRRREFVSTLSHELRTPLTSVTATLELLLTSFAGPLTDKQREYVQIADRACQSLTQMVDNLLDLERFGRGAIELRPREIDLRALLGELIARFGAAARERQLELRLEAEEVGAVAADPYRFEQVVGNLLGNAIKFASPGSVVTASLTGAAGCGELVVLGVHNQGEPIPAEALLGLFERFRQTARRQQAGVRGSGLGLAIVRSIAQAHGGATFAESGASGTSLWVGWPRRRAPAVREVQESPWLFVRGGASPAERVAVATLLAGAGLRVALWPAEPAAQAAMTKSGGVCLALDDGEAPLPTLRAASGAGRDWAGLGQALVRLVLARGHGLTLVPRPAEEVSAVLRVLGLHEVAAGHGLEVMLGDEVDAPAALCAVAAALAPESRRLGPLRAILRQSASGGLPLAVVFIAEVEGYRAVYGAGRLAELGAILQAEVRRAVVGASSALVWSSSGGGAVLCGPAAELEPLLDGVRRRVDAAIRLSLRAEDRSRAGLVVGERRLALPSVAVSVHPAGVDEAPVRAALGI